tara:strand:- start:90635 stop:91324 length:690 start_codon:yes stop_codon:yes gene_type:complete
MKRPKYYPTFLFCLMALGLLTGCTHSERVAAAGLLVPSYKPQNVYNPPVDELSPTPKENIVRVVALPLYYGPDSGPFLDRIDHSIKSEFAKRNLFEVIPLSRHDLMELFSINQLSAAAPLPANFLKTLKEKYAADGVLITELTYYAPYKPLAIGLRTQLISLKSNQTLWAFDDIFDAGNPRVAAAARRFQRSYIRNPYPLDNSANILQSPTRFSRYAANAAFSTILSNE